MFFIKWQKQLHTFEGKSAFKTWLFKIARNTVYDYYRSQKRHKKSFTLEQGLLEDLAGEAEAAEDTVLRNFHIDEILEIIQKLPENYQTILHLRFLKTFPLKKRRIL
ncbi:MAG: sigma-70 family RNA polymerase sigma factor [Bacillus sp. (in: Bacteria)]|nr:sigma-70 family RNA polymerase sigma factor [Bacillus sp. (in: firmicutes)]